MISTVGRLRMAALLGMLGSTHGGERDNAAQLLEQFRRQRGFNWADLLASRALNDFGAVHAGPRPHQAAAGRDSTALFGPPLRSRGDIVWRWSMLLAIAALGMMSLTLLARQYAMEKLIGGGSDGRCLPGMEAANPVGCLPATLNHIRNGVAAAPGAAVAADAMPGPFVQGLPIVRFTKLGRSWRGGAVQRAGRSRAEEMGFELCHRPQAAGAVRPAATHGSTLPGRLEQPGPLTTRMTAWSLPRLFSF